MIELKNSIEEVNFYVSFIGKMILVNDVLAILAINLGISEHSINIDKKEKYIDFSIVLITGVRKFYLPDDNLTIDKDGIDKVDKYYFGGTNMSNMMHMEYNVEGERAVVLINENYALSSNYWIPVKTPKLNPNMDERQVQTFLNTDVSEIKALIKKNT